MEAVMMIGSQIMGSAAASTAGSAVASAAGSAAAASGAASMSDMLLASSVMSDASAFGSFASMSSILPMVGKGLTFASMAGNALGGFQQAGAITANAQAQAEALAYQSREAELQAKQEETAARQESNTIMDNLVQTIAAQRLAFSGNGMDLSFGTPVNVEQSTRKMADLQLSTSRQDAYARILSRRRQSYSLLADRANVLSAGKSSASSAISGGLMDAAGSAGQYLMRGVARG